MRFREELELARGRLGAFLTWTLALAAFGPYLLPGVRVDNAMTWLIAPVAIWTLASLTLSRRSWFIIGAWVAFLVTAAISHTLPVLNTSPYSGGNVVAGIDAFAAPIVVLLVGFVLVEKAGRDRVFVIVSRVLSVGMVGNALLALVQWASPTARLLTGRFWGLSLEDGSTLARAATQDRFSGIMQQPALAGAMYGVAMILATHVFAKRPIIRDITWLLLLLGGGLCASKAFWFIGFPIAVILRIYLARTSDRRDGWKSFFVFAPVAALAISLDVSIAAIGGSLLSALGGIFDAATSGVAGVTGNRFGDGGVVFQLASHVFADAPIAGYGIGGLSAAVDSGFVEAFVVAGLVGVVCLVAVCCALLRGAWLHRAASDGLGPVILALTLAVVFLTFGFPILTGNRSTLLLWLLLAVSLSRESWEDVGRAHGRSKSIGMSEHNQGLRLSSSSSSRVRAARVGV